MSNAYNKRELVAELAEKFKISKRRTDNLLTELALIAYREAPTGFTLPGICKMDIKERKERRARNPHTGDTLLIGAHKVLRVRPLKAAKQAVAPTPPDLIQVMHPDMVEAEKAAKLEAEVAAASQLLAEAGVMPVVEPSAPAVTAVAEDADELTDVIISVEDPDSQAGGVVEEQGFYSFKCNFCRADIEVSFDCAGDRINCPACNHVLTVPTKEEAAKSAQIKSAVPKAMPQDAMDSEEQFISFLCKSCGQEIEAPIDMAGSQDECPSCNASILVPYVSEPGTTQALKASSASAAAIEAAKSRTLRIELPDDL